MVDRNKVDRDKVISGIKHHIKGECNGCPYCKGGHACETASENGLFTDILALLESHEQHGTQKKSKRYNDMDWSGAQGNDGEQIREQAARSEWGIYG